MERPPWIPYLGCSASVAPLLVAEVEQALPGSDSNSSDTGCVWLFLSTPHCRPDCVPNIAGFDVVSHVSRFVERRSADTKA